jgi:hypothetical protein
MYVCMYVCMYVYTASLPNKEMRKSPNLCGSGGRESENHQAEPTTLNLIHRRTYQRAACSCGRQEQHCRHIFFVNFVFNEAYGVGVRRGLSRSLHSEHTRTLAFEGGKALYTVACIPVACILFFLF